MTRSEFHTLSFWVDYDRPKLPNLTRAQRIEYFRRRAHTAVIRPIHHLLSQLRQSGRRSSTVLCFGTCACCAIEAFGRFHTGKVGWGSGSDSFKAFVRDFMHADFKRRLHGKTYAKLLYDHFRNGLAHGFTIKWGGFEHSASYFQVKSIGAVSVLEIDPAHFYRDVKAAAAMFLTKLRTAPDADSRFARFNHVFEELWVKGN